jgi:hypothetical protein
MPDKERSHRPRTFYPKAVSLSEPSECSVDKVPAGEPSLSGERWQFNGDGEGWAHVTNEPRKAKRPGIDAEARQDWSNDE